MRRQVACWRCTAILAGHVRGAWAIVSNNNKRKSGISGKSDYEKSNRLGWIGGQQILGTECPLDHRLCPEAVGGGCCPKNKACGATACFPTTTVQSAVVVAHPKITEAPLFKRKLGSNKWDSIHNGIQGQKRDATVCPADYQLCPQSMSGGCCPNDRVCGTSSCYAASSAPVTACGLAGYIACGIPEGGGCCPENYSCEVGGCSPLPGVSYSETCDISSYLCPASVGYGCCKDGYACGLTSCYATSITTFTLTETFTTTDASSHPHTVTSTVVTAQTPSIPTAVVALPTGSGVIPKVTPLATAIPKTNATSTTSNGLTRPELGGIIGGAITILIILLIATYLIIRRLNKAIKASTASKSQTRRSSSVRRSRPSYPTAADIRDIDALSVDPLIMTPSEAAPTFRHLSYPSDTHSSAYEVDGSSPPAFSNPFSPRSPTFAYYQKGYKKVPASESNSSSGRRHTSLDSTPTLVANSSTSDYFDIPIQPDLRDQNLRFGHSPPPRRPSHRRWKWSDASDVSKGSSIIVELDAGPFEDRRSSLQKALHGLGGIASRRNSSQSGPSTPTGSVTNRPELGSFSSPGAVGLGYIPEAGESRVMLHGGMTNAQLRQSTLLELSSYPAASVRGEHENTTGHGIGVVTDQNYDPGSR